MANVVKDSSSRSGMFVILVTVVLSLGGFVLALFVRVAARLQYLENREQYIRSTGDGIVITAGMYFSILSTLYLFLAFAGFLAVFLYRRQETENIGRFVLSEVYTLGMVRAVFAIFFEGRFEAFGILFMLFLVLVGCIFLYLINGHRYSNYIIFLLQVAAAIIAFSTVDFIIHDPVPLVSID